MWWPMKEKKIGMYYYYIYVQNSFIILETYVQVCINCCYGFEDYVHTSQLCLLQFNRSVASLKVNLNNIFYFSLPSSVSHPNRRVYQIPQFISTPIKPLRLAVTIHFVMETTFSICCDLNICNCIIVAIGEWLEATINIF